MGRKNNILLTGERTLFIQKPTINGFLPHFPGSISRVTALKQRLFGIKYPLAIQLISSIWKMKNGGKLLPFEKYTQCQKIDLKKDTAQFFLLVANCLLLEVMEKRNEGLAIFLFWGGRNGTGLCHNTSNCFVCSHKGCFHYTSCKQLQVKGQCIFYPRRKGNAYIIQSASASHVH